MPHDSDETLWSQYEDMGACGCGGCSEIILAKHQLTGILVAIKILEKEDELFYKLAFEVDFLKNADHQNIVTLFQIIETKERIYLVLELCTRSFSQLICQKGHLKEDEARRIFWEILQAIRYCQDHGMAHLDIKPNNIMLDFMDKVKVIDFGLATQFRPGERFTFQCGVYTYLPPELYQHQPYDLTKKDILSLGILLYHMVTGRVPFKLTTLWSLKQRILSGEYEVAPHISAELAELISLLLTVDPDLRPTVNQVMTHAWLQQCRGGFCHHEETLPKRLDPDILEAMRTIGFDPHETGQSIVKRTYEQSMATYLLIQYGAACIRRRGTGPDKPVFPGAMPFPVTDPAAFPLHQKRKQTVPVLQAGSSLIRVQESESQQPGQKSCMSARLPSVLLSCLQTMPPISPSPKHLCPGTPFPSHSLELPESMPSFQTAEENLPVETSSRGPCGQGSSLQHPEGTSSTYGKEEHPAAPSSRGPQGPGRPAASHRGLRSWKICRGVENCVRTLCRRLRTSHPLKNTVAPVTVPGPNCQPFTSGSPRPPGRPPSPSPPSPEP